MGNELERIANMAPLLQSWAQQRHGPTVSVKDVDRLPGHSGITFSFAVQRDGDTLERSVIKVPPLGVSQCNNTDILRQVPVLHAMADHGVRVPKIVAWGDSDDGPFPVPYLIVEHVRGSTLGDVFNGPMHVDGQLLDDLIDAAIAELATIHTVSWEPDLREWSRVHQLRDEIDHWVPVLKKAQDQNWIDRGMAVHRRLVDTTPETHQQEFGVVHGDYYSNNLLFDDNCLTAVLDWENSCIGAQFLDIGWLCMIYDKESWGPTRRAWMADSLNPGWLLSRYEHHSGRSVRHASWYRALAGYRLACLTAYYLRLHRLGRRVDSVWEVFGESFPYLLDQAEALLTQS